MVSGGILMILGVTVFGGMVGAWLFQRIKFPQVVGYIVIGLLLGESIFGVVKQTDVANLRILTQFALGIIGFLVGGELQISTFKKYARQFTSILLFEGMMTFVLVSLATFLLIYLVSRQLVPSMAVGLVFGAIASATDPASTMDVIWEYRAKGIMTTAIIAVIALDDALAMTLYALSSGVLKMVSGSGSTHSMFAELGYVLAHLAGSLLLGAIFAGILTLFFKIMTQLERAAAISVGILLLVIGVAGYFGLDVILATMSAGFVLTNLEPRRSEQVFKLLRSFSIPIYVMFFVLVGARLSLGNMPFWLWGVVFLYILFRSVGKVVGSYYGAKITGAPAVIQRYLGFGIFAQGGVAIGLAIVASEKLNTIKVAEGLSMGDMVVYVVTSTTLLLQLFGPAMVKLSVKWAGEAGKNITEEDVMAKMHVYDVVDDKLIVIEQRDSVAKAVEYFTRNDALIYPVVDKNKNICGILTFEALKDILSDRDSWQWLLVADVMRPLVDLTTPNQPLKEVYDKMLQLKIDQMPIVDGTNRKKPLGVLDIRNIRQKVHAELLKTIA